MASFTCKGPWLNWLAWLTRWVFSIGRLPSFRMLVQAFLYDGGKVHSNKRRLAPLCKHCSNNCLSYMTLSHWPKQVTCTNPDSRAEEQTTSGWKKLSIYHTCISTLGIFYSVGQETLNVCLLTLSLPFPMFGQLCLWCDVSMADFNPSSDCSWYQVLQRFWLFRVTG